MLYADLNLQMEVPRH